MIVPSKSSGPGGLRLNPGAKVIMSVETEEVVWDLELHTSLG